MEVYRDISGKFRDLDSTAGAARHWIICPYLHQRLMDGLRYLDIFLPHAPIMERSSSFWHCNADLRAAMFRYHAAGILVKPGQFHT